MVNSSISDFKTFFLTFILFEIVIASTLSYFGILFDKPILITISQIFIIISILFDIGICIGNYSYNYLSNFIKTLENYEIFKLEEDSEDQDEINKYNLNEDLNTNLKEEKNYEISDESSEENENIKPDEILNQSNEENENIKPDEILNQSNEELNEYLSNEYNKAINDLMNLIQREISKKDD